MFPTEFLVGATVTRVRLTHDLNHKYFIFSLCSAWGPAATLERPRTVVEEYTQPSKMCTFHLFCRCESEVGICVHLIQQHRHL